MRRGLLLVGTLLLVGCNILVGWGDLDRAGQSSPGSEELEDGGPGGGQSPAPGRDAGTDAPSGPRCDPSKPFRAPKLIPGKFHAASPVDHAPTLTDDELTLVFGRYSGSVDSSILVARRSSIAEPFGDAVVIAELSAEKRSSHPAITGDGLRIVYRAFSVSGTTVTSNTLMTATRSLKTEPFSAPQPFSGMLSGKAHSFPGVGHDGSEVYFGVTEANGGIHLYRSLRGNVNDYAPATRLDELVFASGSESSIAISGDALTLFFGSLRTGTDGPNDVYVARRPTRTAPFAGIERVAELSSPGLDLPTWLSLDGCRLYMQSSRESARGLLVAERP